MVQNRIRTGSTALLISKTELRRRRAGGFKGVGIRHADLEHVLQKRSLEAMKKILDDNRMKHVELEFLKDWFLDGERKNIAKLKIPYEEVAQMRPRC